MKKLWKSRPFIVSVIVTLAALVCVSGVWFSTVLAKYISESGRDGIISSNDFDLSYQVQDPFYVSTTAALYDAIQYGYSHIKLVDTNEEWVLSESTVAALNRPMILDLNGNELVRNSTEPFLDIKKGVTLTLLDTSADQSAGLYNPVGSVLTISGGKLLVKGGKFETGPRYWEYYNYTENNGKPNAARVDTDTLVAGQRKADARATTVEASYPVIIPTVADGKVRGNIYFDSDLMSGETLIIPADTYIYYVSSDNSTGGDTTEIDVEAATFTYSYTADKSNGYAYVGTAEPANENEVTITIYGYEDDIATASYVETADSDKKNPNYAAIKMLDGGLVVNVEVQDDDKWAYYNLEASGTPITKPRTMRGGCFINYFGVPQSACIYQAGGEMNVEKVGVFVAANPTDFPTTAQGTAMPNSGEASCIVTSDDNQGVLLIQAGVYRAYNMNTVRVMSGEVHIGKGIFDKFSSVTTARAGRTAVYVDQSSNTSAVCDVTGAEFRVYSQSETPLVAASGGFNGQNVYAIYVDGGELKMTDTKVELHGSYSTGVYTAGGKTTLSNVDMTVTGNNHIYGVFSDGGDIDVTTSDASGDHSTHNVWIFGEENTTDPAKLTSNTYAIYGRNGADIDVEKTDITLHGPSSRGVLMGGATSGTGGGTADIHDTNFLFTQATANSHAATIQLGTLTVQNSSVHMSGARSVGINITDGNAIVDNLTMTFIESASNSGAVQLNGGQLTFNNSHVLMNGLNCSALYSLKGDIYSQDCYIRLTGEKAFGIYASAGNIVFKGAALTMESPVQSYGIAAVSDSTDSLMVDMIDSSIVVGGFSDAQGNFTGWNDSRATSTQDQRTDASMGITLSNLTTSRCYIALNDTSIHAVDIGVGVRKGYLFIQGSGHIQSKNASALAVSSGDLYIGDVVGYEEDQLVVNGQSIPGTIDIDAFHALSKNEQRDAIAEATSPLQIHCSMGDESGLTQGTDVGNVASIVNHSTWTESALKKYFQTPDPTPTDKFHTNPFNFVDGIYVSGGNVVAKTNVKVRFAGYRNAENKDYATVFERSFALHVIGGDVTLAKADIINYCGGGLLAAGGNVTLGTKDSTNRNDVTVQTMGALTGAKYDPAFVVADDWKVARNYTGGNGVVVNNGNLTVYNATVTTSYGSGFLILCDKKQDNGALYHVEIHDGQYLGKGQKNAWNTGGPGATYGLKILGQADVHIYGGEYGGGNGGALFTGTLGKASNRWFSANIYVYAGKFGYLYNSEAERSTWSCLDGINIYEGVNIVFGAYSKAQLNERYGSNLAAIQTAVEVKAGNAAVVVNPMASQEWKKYGKDSTVKVYYGSYQSQTPFYTSGTNQLSDPAMAFANYSGVDSVRDCQVNIMVYNYYDCVGTQKYVGSAQFRARHHSSVKGVYNNPVTSVSGYTAADYGVIYVDMNQTAQLLNRATIQYTANDILQSGLNNIETIVKQNDTTTGLTYLHVVPNGGDPHWDALKNKTGSRFMVIIYRTNNASNTTLQAFLSSDGSVTETGSMKGTLVTDNQWHALILDGSTNSKYNGSNVAHLRIDPMSQAPSPAGAYVDIAYICFFESSSDALDWLATQPVT